MKIGIDARLFRQTGVGVYIQNLLEELSHLKTDDLQFIIFALPEDIQEITALNKKFIVKEAPFHWHSVSEQTGFYQLLMDENLDLMHFTYFSYPIRYKRKFIITIHDLIPYHFKTGQASTHNHITYNLKHEAYKFVVRSAVKNATKIIVPTNTVRDDITATFGSRYRDKIAVTYEGIRKNILTASPDDSMKGKLAKPFFLYVGNFYPHKNVERLLSAFSPYADKYDLVLVGPNDFFASKLQKQKGIIFLTDISTARLIYLYKKAEALIHPSLSEGFGLPLLEASYLGLPIIASDIPVFKEILGDSYLSFDPASSQDIAEKISHFISEKNQHTPIAKSILLDTFSFRKMTEKTLALYRQSV